MRILLAKALYVIAGFYSAKLYGDDPEWIELKPEWIEDFSGKELEFLERDEDQINDIEGFPSEDDLLAIWEVLFLFSEYIENKRKLTKKQEKLLIKILDDFSDRFNPC